MKRQEALKEARRQLEDDANELAMWSSENRDAPHMILVAVRREIERLREVARVINPRKEGA